MRNINKTNPLIFKKVRLLRKNIERHIYRNRYIVYDREIENLKINFSVFSKYFENNQR